MNQQEQRIYDLIDLLDRKLITLFDFAELLNQTFDNTLDIKSYEFSEVLEGIILTNQTDAHWDDYKEDLLTAIHGCIISK